MPKKKKPNWTALAHHRHTGKVLPHHHTSWPFVALLVLMLGVFLVQFTFQVKAADVTVNAKADGPIPTQPAVISSPLTGSTVTHSPITVSGTCQPDFVVRLYRNNLFSGSAACQADGTFSIVTDLFVGQNELKARIFNYADQEGPSSSGIIVTYKPPATTGGTTPAANPESPFLLMTDKYYKAGTNKQSINWTFEITGGDSPFYITVDWGDGQTSNLDDVKNSGFSVSHTYKKGSKEREYFTVRIKVTDAKGREANLQVFNIVNFTEITGGGSLATGGGSFLNSLSEFLQQMKFIWSAYALLVLMAVSFWLGQQTKGLPIIGGGKKQKQ